jgi:hypothetical protein
VELILFWALEIVKAQNFNPISAEIGLLFFSVETSAAVQLEPNWSNWKPTGDHESM